MPASRPALVALALLTLPLGLASPAVADHTSGRDRLQCDGGWCDDGEDHVLDCSKGFCEGDPSGFATIVEPSYTDTPRLDADDFVLGVDIDETPRAYRIKYMNVFETIEETLAGEPVVITYCPLCGSGVVWNRNVSGETLRFLNTGEIWRNDLVMYDTQTESRWTQVGGEAIQGPKHGETLELRPSTVTTWAAWREDHPDTLVLSRPVDEDGDDLAPYEDDPYAAYRYRASTPQPRHANDDTGLHPKTRVVGVQHGGAAFALPVPVMREQQVLETDVGGLSIVAGYDGDAVHVYHREGKTFRPGANGTMLDGDRTAWAIGSGEALDGSGQLERVPTESLFWFAWLEFHPSTGVLTDDQAVLEPEPPGGGSERLAPWAGTASLLTVLGAALALARRGHV